MKVFMTACFLLLAAGLLRAEDDLPDVGGLRDPFVSLLPKPQKVKTPVEPAMQKIDNTMVQRPKPPQPAHIVPPAPPAPPPALQLQGVIWGSDEPTAIVNGKVVGVGDKVSGLTVQSITRQEVVFLYNGEKINVRMGQ